MEHTVKMGSSFTTTDKISKLNFEDILQIMKQIISCVIVEVQKY